jgi:hypothetical protein
MENKVEVVIHKDQVEQWFAPRTFTDKEWEVLAYEIQELLEHTIDLQLADIIADLDNLVEQDSKFD